MVKWPNATVYFRLALPTCVKCSHVLLSLVSPPIGGRGWIPGSSSVVSSAEDSAPSCLS